MLYFDEGFDSAVVVMTDDVANPVTPRLVFDLALLVDRLRLDNIRECSGQFVKVACFQVVLLSEWCVRYTVVWSDLV